MTESRFYEPARLSTPQTLVLLKQTAGRHNLVEVIVM